MEKPKTPRNLGTAGRDLWKAVIEHEPPYELRPDEINTLANACREADLIDQLQKAQETAPLVTKGSMGQEVISPFISELRQHRTVLSNLLKSLHLPDSPGGSNKQATYNSEMARKAAAAKWRTARGA